MITYVDAIAKSRRTAGVIPIHGTEGFEGMRKAGRLTAETLDMLTEYVKPGMPTIELDRMAASLGHLDIGGRYFSLVISALF